MKTYRPPLSHRILVAAEWPSLGLNAIIIGIGILAFKYGWTGKVISVGLLAFQGRAIARTLALSISVSADGKIIVRNPMRTYSLVLDNETKIMIDQLYSVYPIAAGFKIVSPSGKVTAVAPAVLTSSDRKALINELRSLARRSGAHVDLPSQWPGTW